MFAMKVIRKVYTVKKEQGKHTVQERRIMAAVSFEEYKARRGLITAGVIKVFMQDNPSNLK
jgi:hypothetical protein